MARLQFIRRAKALGFSLDEIRDLLSLQDANGARAMAKHLADHKLNEIRRRIDELKRMEAALADMHARYSGHGPALCCPIIEALAGRVVSHEPSDAIT